MMVPRPSPVRGLSTIAIFAIVSFLDAHPLLSGDVATKRPDRVEFNRDIRPILSDRCFACHGPDKNKREADLRLDTEAGLKGLSDHPVPVVPGKPNESEVVRRIESDDPAERMPPKEFGKDLSPEEKGLIHRWIEQGAPWQGHWSFQPVQKPELPAVADPRFDDNVIDRFVFAAIEREA
jgi:hypothetical protein